MWLRVLEEGRLLVPQPQVRMGVRVPGVRERARVGVWELLQWVRRLLPGVRVWVVVWRRVLAVGRSLLRIQGPGASCRTPEHLPAATMSRSTTTTVFRPSATQDPESARSRSAPSSPCGYFQARRTPPACIGA